MMMPELTKGDLSLMPREQQKRICKHDPACEHFFVMMFANKDIMMCEGNIHDFAESILNQANKGSKKERGKREYTQRKRWTDEEKKVIREILNTSHKGANQIIAKQLGREPSHVAAQVKRMRTVGEL